MPEPWVLITVGGVAVYLIGLAFSAQVSYENSAGDWLKVHLQWLQELGTNPATDVEYPTPPGGLPTPLKERLQLLMSPSVTSLADGDLGRFLLRRPEIKGQSALGAVANLLISIALASTILGLIVTLFGLVVRLAGNSNTGLKDMVGAIAHFPWFFIPTCIGVLLGAWAHRRQMSIDSDFDQMWDQIDTFTIVHLLPKYIKPKSALDAATEKLMQAATLFEGSGQKLAGTIGQLEGAASKLSQLDPTQWAVGLKDTSEKFERATEAYQKHVGTLGQAVKGFGEMLNQQTEVTKANSQSIGEVTELVKDAAGYKDELAKTLLGFQKSVEKVDGLRSEIENFGSDVSGLSASLANWANIQDSSSTTLVSEVGKITNNVQPILDEWQKASGFFHDNHQTFKAELESLAKKFTDFQQEFEKAQSGQLKALDTLVNSFSEGAIKFWGNKVSQQLEQFDHPADVLQELRKLSASLEGAQELGTSLPTLSDSLSNGSLLFSQTISSLSGTVEQLSVQQKSHQEALIEVSQRLAQISEKLDRPAMHETSPAATSTLSSRTILGLPIGPPPWMSRLLKRFSKEGKP